MTDIVERLRCWVIATDAVPASDLMDEAADEIERLRNGALESRETVRDGVVPTVTWFDQKIAEECRIAQAEAARLRLTHAEREAIEESMRQNLESDCISTEKAQETNNTLAALLARLA